MEKENRFFLNKNSIYNKYSKITLGLSFDVKKRLDDSDAMISFYDSNFINCTIKLSLDKQFKKILELFLETSDDDNPPDTLLICLDESEKLRRKLINNYEAYLDKKHRLFFEKKIELLQKDIKKKIVTCRLSSVMMNERLDSDYEEVEERHHTR